MLIYLLILNFCLDHGFTINKITVIYEKIRLTPGDQMEISKTGLHLVKFKLQA